MAASVPESGNFSISIDDLLNLDERKDGFVELEIDPSIFDEEMPIPESPEPVAVQTRSEIPGDSPQPSTSCAHSHREEIENFINQQSNQNTMRKMLSDIRKLEHYLKSNGENRPMYEIPMEELDTRIAGFVMNIKKPDGSEYEPSSVRGMISSFDRKLRRHGYQHSIINSQTNAFSLTRETLKAKMKSLKKDGKGNRPHEAEPLTDDDINVLYEKDLLGSKTPSAMINTLWLNNCLHFGMRGVTEHYELRWGDVSLKNDGTTEYLELNERQTKTRTGANITDVRKIKPKLFSTKTDRDPVLIYKLFVEKRPESFNLPDSPFYIAARTTPVVNDSDQWFLRQRIGRNKLSSLMKSMCEKAGLSRKLTNHSARKHLVQKLRDNNVPPTDIMQISGHKNVQSVLNYSSISLENQMRCSNILAGTCSSSHSTESVTNNETYRNSSANQSFLENTVSSAERSETVTQNTVVPVENHVLPVPVTPPTTVPCSQHLNIPTFHLSTQNNSVITPIFYGAVLNIGTLNVFPNHGPNEDNSTN